MRDDPPVLCTKMSAALLIPSGSIGPRRARRLDRLRRSPHLAASIERGTTGNQAEDTRISGAGGGQRG